MDEYVERMIKDKFLLEIITTAFYEYRKPVEVLHPDLEHQYDLILSCNGCTQLIRIKCKYFYDNGEPDFSNLDDDQIKTLLDENNVCDITLVVDEKVKILEIQMNSSIFQVDELLKKLFKFEDHKSPLPVSETYKYEKSTFSEQFGTYSFIRDIRETARLNFNGAKITILRGEVDAFGYDLVLICNNIVRYVQLKLSKSRMQPVNIALAYKKGACVVWQREKEKLKFGYHFLGEKPNGYLDFLEKKCKPYKHKGKEKRSKRAVKFTDLCDLSCLYYLDESNGDFKLYKNKKHKNKKMPSLYCQMTSLIHILFDIDPTGTP